MQKKISSVMYLLVIGITTLFLVFSFRVYQQKFTAPSWADTIKNPLKNNASSVIAGKKLYGQYCVICHGEKGKGDGVSVAGLSKKPTDHTSSEFQKQSDGAIFWEIGNGSSPMPMFKATFKPIQIWQLENYIRTLPNASKK